MRHTRRMLISLAVTVTVATAACSDALTGPADASAVSQVISTTELGQALDSAPARIEITLERGSLVAREVELQSPDEMTDEEYVRGQVTGVALSAGTGTLTFEIGGLEVAFAPSARFRDDVAGDGNLTMDEFIRRIQAALADGSRPAVRAKRPATAIPQAPDDPTFQATELRIHDQAERPKIELNVDADNFQVNDQPPPQAWLRVFGLAIEIRSTTQVRAFGGGTGQQGQSVEFGGAVQSADPAAGSFTLTSGVTVRLNDATVISTLGDLVTLEAVADARGAGKLVRAEGRAIVESAGPPATMVAVTVKWEVDD